MVVYSSGKLEDIYTRIRGKTPSTGRCERFATYDESYMCEIRNALYSYAVRIRISPETKKYQDSVFPGSIFRKRKREKTRGEMGSCQKTVVRTNHSNRGSVGGEVFIACFLI